MNALRQFGFWKERLHVENTTEEEIMQIECRSTQITSARPASMKDVQQNCKKVIWTELDHVKEAAELDLVMGI